MTKYSEYRKYLISLSLFYRIFLPVLVLGLMCFTGNTHFLILFYIFADDKCVDIGITHAINAEECVSGNSVGTETAAENEPDHSVRDETVAHKINVTVFESVQEEATAAESSIKFESENDVAAGTVTHEISSAECKSEEGVTHESTECEMNVADYTVKVEDCDTEKQTEDEHAMSEVDIVVKCESRKESGESENQESTEKSDDLKVDSQTASDLRLAVDNADMLQKYETEAVAVEVDGVRSNVRNSVDQDFDLVQEMTVSDADHMTYEPNMVPEHDVIHESAILDSTDYIFKDANVVQDNSNSKDCDTKTAVDVSGEMGSVSELEDSKVDEDEDAEEVQAALIAAVARSEACCWDVVDSTEKLLAEVPLVALEAVPVPVRVPVTLAVVEEGEALEEVEVIPMQEELEVRLEEGTFPVAPEDALSMDWPYPMKMDSGIVAPALDDVEGGTSSSGKLTQAQYPEFSTSQAVKLELEG